MGATDDTDGRLLWRVRIHPSGPSVPSVASVVQFVKPVNTHLCQDPGQPPPPARAQNQAEKARLVLPPAGAGARAVEKAGGKLEHQSLRKLRFVLQAVDALSEPLPSALHNVRGSLVSRMFNEH